MKYTVTLVMIILCLVGKAQTPPDYPAVSPIPPVVKAEYFFDEDPGFGNGTPINLTAGTNIPNFTTTLDLNGSALTNGFHRLYIRTQNDEGKWSLGYHAFFDNYLISSYPVSTGHAQPLVESEYFIDDDPGLGLGKKIQLPSEININSFNALLDISNLSQGAHRLFVRSRNAADKWSFTYYAVFDNSSMTPYPQAPPPAPEITVAEYYFDDDPGFGNGVPLTLPASTNIANFSFDAPVNSLGQGMHVIYLRSKQNPWSLTAYSEFLIGSALPVSWVYVKAEVKDRDALISWATAEEYNADKFIIEYSKDGVSFNSAGELPASNTNMSKSYSFRHIRPGTGLVYYRIKQLDKDGHSTYSRILMLLFKADMKEPVLFPNPATSLVHIVMPPGNAARSIELYDMSGRLLHALPSSTISQPVSFSVQELKAGQYIVVIRDSTKTSTLFFLKK